MTKRHKVLDFETFKVEQNNFWLYFINNFFGNCCRKSDFYIRCKRENEVFRKVEKKLRRVHDYDSLRNHHLLYQAYIMMHYYVDNNEKLFQ